MTNVAYSSGGENATCIERACRQHAPTRPNNTTKQQTSANSCHIAATDLRGRTLTMTGNNCKVLAPYILGTLVVVSGLTSCCWLGIILVGAGLIALWRFRFPQLSKERAATVLQPGQASIIAHRCGASEAPENTIAGIKEAKRNGASGIEFDVGYTSDGVAVLMHDDSLDRTTDGTGLLADMPWEKVKHLNASAKDANKDKFSVEKVPSLEDAVKTCLELGLKIFFDVKGNPEQSARTIPGLYRQYPELYKCGIVCSFYPQIIYKVRQADPDIVTGLTWRPNYVAREDIDGKYREGALWKRGLMVMADLVMRYAQVSWLPVLCGSSAFLVHQDCVNAEMIQHFEKMNIQVLVWTVNDPVQKKFLQETLKTSVITDCVKH